jgi:hypothetical protein
MSFELPPEGAKPGQDKLYEAIRLRLQSVKAPESLRARIAAMLEVERGPGG